MNSDWVEVDEFLSIHSVESTEYTNNLENKIEDCFGLDETKTDILEDDEESHTQNHSISMNQYNSENEYETCSSSNKESEKDKMTIDAFDQYLKDEFEIYFDLSEDEGLEKKLSEPLSFQEEEKTEIQVCNIEPMDIESDSSPDSNGYSNFGVFFCNGGLCLKILFHSFLECIRHIGPRIQTLLLKMNTDCFRLDDTKLK